MEKIWENFWTKVEKRGPDDCWPWLATKDKDGYGLFGNLVKGRERRANRITWFLTNGPIPKGLYVLHTCDEPSCCNPVHLWLGTPKDNTQDAIRKGRFVNPPRHIGEANPGGGKLTENDVREIRKLRATGKYTLTEIGDMKGVTFAMIWLICNGRAWNHVK